MDKAQQKVYIKAVINMVTRRLEAEADANFFPEKWGGPEFREHIKDSFQAEAGCLDKKKKAEYKKWVDNWEFLRGGEQEQN